MADPEHEVILRQGAGAWNYWRWRQGVREPDLSGADLMGCDLSKADLVGANFRKADLSGADLDLADLRRANLRCVNLSGARLVRANLRRTDLNEADLTEANLLGAKLARAKLNGANLRRANLTGARLQGANLVEAKLEEANLRGANLLRAKLTRARLSMANLIEANLRGADLKAAYLEATTLVHSDLRGTNLCEAKVFGASVWRVELDDTTRQTDIRVSPGGESVITVDNLEVAQFVDLLLHNEKIRGAIDTIGRKGILILGRFYDERKAVLDAIRERLRDFNLVPIVFDWDKPSTRDLTESIQLLANLSRFVVADVTDAKSIPQELSHIVPFLPSVPVRPIILAGEYEYAMFEHWTGYNTMLPVFQYDDKDHLIDNIETAILEPVKQWEAGYDKTRSLEEEVARLRAELAEQRAGR